jgi:hypothetical protein
VAASVWREVAFEAVGPLVDTRIVKTRSPVSILALGALAVAVLDGLDAVLVWGARGVSPLRVFQGIAAGFFGRATFQGGAATALAGVGVHVLVASGVVLVCYAAWSRWRALNRHPLLYGAAYGVCVYVFMNLVVIPLSAIGGPRFTTVTVVNGLFIHVVGVGIPAALFARVAVSMADARRRMASPLSSGRTLPNPSTSALAGSRRDR